MQRAKWVIYVLCPAYIIIDRGGVAAILEAMRWYMKAKLTGRMLAPTVEKQCNFSREKNSNCWAKGEKKGSERRNSGGWDISGLTATRTGNLEGLQLWGAQPLDWVSSNGRGRKKQKEKEKSSTAGNAGAKEWPLVYLRQEEWENKAGLERRPERSI